MHSTTPKPDDVITLPAAARLLGVGPTTLKRWSDQGRIPHTRTPGGHRRFLRSVILDFRALVDPRAGVGQRGGHLSLQLGEPREWVDRAHTLADPDRMEAALLGLRSSCAGWGETADAVLDEFVDRLEERRRAGRLSEGAGRALRRSIVRSAHRAAGRLRPRIGAPVAMLASTGDDATEVHVALAEAVLREQGYTVLDAGRADPTYGLEELLAEQQPHLLVLLAERGTEPTALRTLLGGACHAATGSGAELWLAGRADWPVMEGTLRLDRLGGLGARAARRIAARDASDLIAREG